MKYYIQALYSLLLCAAFGWVAHKLLGVNGWLSALIYELVRAKLTEARILHQQEKLVNNFYEQLLINTGVNHDSRK